MSELASAIIRQQLEATPELISIIRARAAERPDHPAVVFHRSPMDPTPWTLTYRELSTQAQAVVARLRSAGIAPDRGIAILSPSTPAAVAALVGATAIGAAFPLNPLLTPEAMSAQLALGRVGAAFVAEEHPSIDHQTRLNAALGSAPVANPLIELPLDRGANVTDWRQLRGARKPLLRQPVADGTLVADRAAALFHTGGTTGEPKLAELSARSLAAGALMSAAALNLQASDRIFIALPLFHVGGAITCTFATLAAGATAIFCGVLGAREPDLPAEVWKFLAATTATVVAMVPTSLGMVVRTPVADADLGRLRGVITGASPLSPRLARDLEELLDVPVCQVFGMTELSGICTAQPLDGRRRSHAVGYPAPLLHVDLVKSQSAPEAREVLLNGPNAFLGYRTRNGLVGAPSGDGITSGDLGIIGDDGQLRLIGRSKDVIIRSGHNIDPLLIEDVAYVDDAVMQAAAVGMPDSYAGEVPVLYITLRPGCTFDLESFKSALRCRIAEPPARPRSVFVVDALPLTPVGKIARYKLRQDAALRVVEAVLSDLPIAGLRCDDIAAKRIEVAWRPEAAQPDRAKASERILMYGLELKA